MKEKEDIKDFKGYQSFKLIPSYSDYGDVTNWQTMRRFIAHCNKYFEHLNDGIKEFLKLYESMLETMDEFDAFITAWETMKKDNAEFKKDVHEMLENWIDDPRLKALIDERLLNNKLDKTVFELFKEELNKTIEQITKENELEHKRLEQEDVKLQDSIVDLDDKLSKDILSKLEKGDFDAFIKSYKENTDLPLDMDVFTVKRKDTAGNPESATIKVIKIPYKNSDGSTNMPIPEYYPGRKTIEANKGEDKMLVFNGGYGMGRHGDGIEGRNLINGKIINDKPSRTENYYTLAWNMAGDMTMLPSAIDCASLLKMGYTEAVSGYRFIIQNHEVQYWDTDEKSQRMALARMANKDFLLIMADARSNKALGLTIPSLAEEIKRRYNPKEMYMLDGGGSAQAKLNEQNLMPYGDDSATIEFSEYRGVFSHMYFKRPNKLKAFQKHSYDVLGAINSSLLNEITPFMFTRTTTDLNLASENGFYWCRPSTKNKPRDYTGSCIVLKNEAENFTQIFIQNLNKAGTGKHGLYFRTWVASDKFFTDWVYIGGEFKYQEILNLNTLNASGKYYAPSSATGKPSGVGAGFVELWMNTYNSEDCLMEFKPLEPTNSVIVARRRGAMSGGVIKWGEWVNFTK